VRNAPLAFVELTKFVTLARRERHVLLAQ